MGKLPECERHEQKREELKQFSRKTRRDDVASLLSCGLGGSDGLLINKQSGRGARRRAGGLLLFSCTHLDDQPLHFTRNSNFPWKEKQNKNKGRREAAVRRRRRGENNNKKKPPPPTPGPGPGPRSPVPGLTFFSRLFRMHSASKTCSPTALSSSMSASCPTCSPLSGGRRRVHLPQSRAARTGCPRPGAFKVKLHTIFL